MDTVSIFGLPFSKMGMAETVRYLADAVTARKLVQVVTANPIIVMAGLEDKAFYAGLQSAELIVPDGAGIVWAANYVGQPVKERVAGYDLLHELLKEGDVRGWSVYLLGASQETIELAAGKIAKAYPQLRIAGYRNGYFGADEDAAIVADIAKAQPDLLFVARALTTQEPWIAAHKKELGVPVVMGVGGSFDGIAGKVKRAPKLFQKLRLEWFYRLLRQPSRFGRMLALPKFAVKVIREKENVTKTHITP